MKPYTVVLLRPSYMQEVTCEKYGQDIYVALIKSATSYEDAIQQARQEVFEADLKDDLEPEELSDYTLCVLFEGIQNPRFYGWQE